MALKLRNIISMEDGEYEDVAPEVAEAAVDEVEAIEAADEVVEETEVIDEYSEELDETVEDVEELEETQEVLETALENPEYEGLDEVAAEMIGQRLRMLAERRGFDVSRVEGVFSKESFNSRTSNRRRKTEIALEGIKDTIVAMWERIKAAVKAVWEAIKNFWKKHISTLGRLLKALEKTQKRARDVKGNPDASKKPKPGASMQRAFFSKNDATISSTLIEGFVTAHKNATGATMDILSEAEKAIKGSYEAQSEVVKAAEQQVSNNTPKAEDNSGAATAESSKIMSVLVETSQPLITVIKSKKLGSEDEPLINGWFAIADEDNLKDEVPKIDIKWDNRDVKPDDKREMEVASSASMVTLCKNTIELIKSTQRLGENFNKKSNDFDKVMNDFSREVNKLPENTQSELRKSSQAAMKLLNDTMRLLPKINSKVIGLNTTLGKQVVSYCNTCISNYKTN